MPELETRYGPLEVPDVQTDTIGRFLATYGEWSALETDLLATVMPEEGRLLDIGAFVGTFSLGLAARVPLSFVCAVEANPAVLPALTANLDRNLSPRHVTECAVVAAGDAPDGQPLKGHALEGNLGSLSFAPTSAEPRQVTVLSERSLTLRDLVEAHGPFDLIKLDVEGLELSILRDAAEWLPAAGSTIWLECNAAPASLDLAALLLGWGRELTFVSFPSHNPRNWRGVRESIYPWAHEAGLLWGPSFVVPDEFAALGCRSVRITSPEDLKLALWRTPRWGHRTWEGLDTVELAAVAGHEALSEKYEHYLGPDWDVRRNDVSGSEAERLAYLRLEQLQEQEARLRETAAALAEAEQLAVARLVEVERYRRQAEEAERQQAELQVRYLAALAEGSS